MTSAPKLLITGGNGQLAQSLCHHPRANEFRLTACMRAELDITNPSDIEKAIISHSPDVMINCAAFTAVDLAETENEAALQINRDAVTLLAKACHEHGIPLIHLSTDYIFDGKKHGAHLETDATHPINQYGRSKWLGEETLREYCEKHLILRVSGVFSRYGHNFYKTMLRLAKERDELTVVSDQITCPTHADDIADALFTMANTSNHWGTYHFCSTPPVSWYEFADAIITNARTLSNEFKAKVSPVPTANHPSTTKRPVNSVLGCEKIYKTFGIKQPSWQSAIHALGIL